MTMFTAWVTAMFTFHKNGLTVAMVFVTIIVEIWWLRLTKTGFLMFVLHKPDNSTKLEENKDKQWPGWKSVHTVAWQAPGTPTVDLEVAANLVTNNTKLHTSNYWSPLACLVEEQEE